LAALVGFAADLTAAVTVFRTFDSFPDLAFFATGFGAFFSFFGLCGFLAADFDGLTTFLVVLDIPAL
jgi:hypothetical protein